MKPKGRLVTGWEDCDSSSVLLRTSSMNPNVKKIETKVYRHNRSDAALLDKVSMVSIFLGGLDLLYSQYRRLVTHNTGEFNTGAIHSFNL